MVSGRGWVLLSVTRLLMVRHVPIQGIAFHAAALITMVCPKCEKGCNCGENCGCEAGCTCCTACEKCGSQERRMLCRNPGWCRSKHGEA